MKKHKTRSIILNIDHLITNAIKKICCSKQIQIKDLPKISLIKQILRETFTFGNVTLFEKQWVLTGKPPKNLYRFDEQWVKTGKLPKKIKITLYQFKFLKTFLVSRLIILIQYEIVDTSELIESTVQELKKDQYFISAVLAPFVFSKLFCEILAENQILNYGKGPEGQKLIKNPRIPKKIKLKAYELEILEQQLYEKLC